VQEDECHARTWMLVRVKCSRTRRTKRSCSTVVKSLTAGPRACADDMPNTVQAGRCDALSRGIQLSLRSTLSRAHRSNGPAAGTSQCRSLPVVAAAVGAVVVGIARVARATALSISRSRSRLTVRGRRVARTSARRPVEASVKSDVGLLQKGATGHRPMYAWTTEFGSPPPPHPPPPPPFPPPPPPPLQNGCRAGLLDSKLSSTDPVPGLQQSGNQRRAR